MTLNKKRIAIVGVLATFFVAMMAGPAGAADVFDTDAIRSAGDVGVSLNLFFVFLGAVLVIFMQAGLRTRRDRLHQSEARGARHVDELRDLRTRVRRVLPRRLPADVRWLQLPGLLRAGRGQSVSR